MAADKNTIELTRSPLKEWLSLEEIRAEISEAAEKQDHPRVAELVASYISAASHSNIDWSKKTWFETLEAYVDAVEINSPTLPFPILKSKEKGQKMPWEYKGRTWYFWANLFSLAYGWSLDKIAALDIDDAIGLYQEIEIDKQLDKEWQYGLTEIAYSYDQKTKKSSFRPLDRPEWMRGITHPKTVMIRKDFMPIGNVIDETSQNTQS